MKYPTIGVIIGRFQVPKLHSGHEELIRIVSEKHERVLILVGDRITPTTKTNPLDYSAREYMLREAAPDAVILPILDHPSDEEWSRSVDRAIDVVRINGDAILYTGRNGFKDYYSGKFKVEVVDAGCDYISASDIRAEITKFTNPNEEFRAGVIHALGNLAHRTYHTVDIAMLKWEGDRLNVLMAQKPQETRWQFPGGFVDKGETFAAAARRELREETGLGCEHPMEFVGDYFIDDWRVRRVEGVDHKTVLMRTWYGWGGARAGDDIEKVEWFDLYNVNKHLDALVVPHHREMVQNLATTMFPVVKQRQQDIQSVLDAGDQEQVEVPYRGRKITT